MHFFKQIVEMMKITENKIKPIKNNKKLFKSYKGKKDHPSKLEPHL